MLSEEWLGINEIYFDDAVEWDRLFAWCDFLGAREARMDFMVR